MSEVRANGPRLILTVKQAAEECQVGEKAIRNAIRDGELDASRLGAHGSLRITRAALDAWVESRSTRRERHLTALPSPLPDRPIKPRPARAPGRFRFSDLEAS